MVSCTSPLCNQSCNPNGTFTGLAVRIGEGDHPGPLSTGPHSVTDPLDKRADNIWKSGLLDTSLKGPVSAIEPGNGSSSFHTYFYFSVCELLPIEGWGSTPTTMPPKAQWALLEKKKGLTIPMPNERGLTLNKRRLARLRQ